MDYKILKTGIYPDDELRYTRVGDACIDVRSTIDVEIPIGGRFKIPLGFALELEFNYCGVIQSRSGNAFKFGVDTIGNVIDSNYRGEVHAILQNNGDKPFIVNVGDRIAQLMISPVFCYQLTKVDELSDTNRGAEGFGSTGVK